MTIAETLALLHDYASLAYQESYDNSGLQVGNTNDTVRAALLTLDVTEDVIDEAIAQNCNLIIAHHPVIFSGLKNLTGQNYVQRIVQKAIKHDINIIAVHTNLDNMRNGVNATIAAHLGLQNTKILSPTTSNLYKLITYAPEAQANDVCEALFVAGAGAIGAYSECSFSSVGNGTFKSDESTKPFIGTTSGEREKVAEQKIEVIVPQHLQQKVQQALLAAHPYEVVAFDWLLLANTNTEIGAGMVGTLPVAMSENEFLALLKNKMNAAVVRHTALLEKPIKTVAVCGGSGSFLLKAAMAAKADIFVSADFKYHQFFDAENEILIADIGHYETEQFTVEIFDEILKKKNVTFAVLLSKVNTNPIKYF